MAIPPHRPGPEGPKPNHKEMAALKRVKQGLAVDAAMHNRLTEAGLIRQVLGGTVLTDNGILWEAVG
jgi:hypothetical protein